MDYHQRHGVDHRVDIWAYGVVLYELATGKRLFKGEDVSDTLAAVLEKFAANFERNGGVIHWARDAAEHNQIVLEILQRRDVRKLVKSKSMLTEECHLNPFLERHGIDVVESPTRPAVCGNI